jgi:hypothetical protein
MRLALSGVAATLCALTLCSNASAEDVVLAPSSAAIPACASAPRLRAVQFDPNREDRSFAIFAGSARPLLLRRGARVGAYTIDHIDRGAVVLASHAQRCSLKLRGELASRELRTVSADAVRSGLRTRQPAAAARTPAATLARGNSGIGAPVPAKRSLSSG